MRNLEKAAIGSTLLLSGCINPAVVGEGLDEMFFGPSENTITIKEANAGRSGMQEYYDDGLVKEKGRTDHHFLGRGNELVVDFAAGEKIQVKGKAVVNGVTYDGATIKFSEPVNIIFDSAVKANVHLWVNGNGATISASGKETAKLIPGQPCFVYGELRFDQGDPLRIVAKDAVPEAYGLWEITSPKSSSKIEVAESSKGK